MLARARRYIIAAGGLTALACFGNLTYGQGQRPPEPPNSAVAAPSPQSKSGQEAEGDNADPGPATPAPTAIKRQGQPKETGGRRRPAAYYDKQDLKAQKAMARQARRMADLALAQIVVGAFALAGLLATIHYTRKTANAAIGATNAAVESAKLARATYIASNRTWVTIALTRVGPVVYGDGSERIILSADAENIGSLPAFQVGITVEAYRDTGDTYSSPDINTLVEKAKASVDDYYHIMLAKEVITEKVETGLRYDTSRSGAIERWTALSDEERAATHFITVAYCVAYRSLASDERTIEPDDWRYSAGVIVLTKADGNPFHSSFGDVDAGALRAEPRYSKSYMT